MSEFDELRGLDASELERRAIAAAKREEPPRELSERMASAIGIPSAVVGGDVGLETVRDQPAPIRGPQPQAAAHAAAGWGATVPWISGVVVVSAVVAAIVLTRSEPERIPQVPAEPPSVHTTPPPVAANESAVIPDGTPRPNGPSPSQSESLESAQPAESAPIAETVAPTPQPRSKGQARSDLRDEIALVENARAAVRAGAATRALDAVRNYQERYPSGSFRPEVAALRIEALAKLGRTTEAQRLAKRFVAQHPGSPLSDRVARVAGLAEP